MTGDRILKRAHLILAEIGAADGIANVAPARTGGELRDLVEELFERHRVQMDPALDLAGALNAYPPAYRRAKRDPRGWNFALVGPTLRCLLCDAMVTNTTLRTIDEQMDHIAQHVGSIPHFARAEKSRSVAPLRTEA